MALWKIQLGRNGQQEAVALEHGIVTIGWDHLGDLSKTKTREGLEELFRNVYPEKRTNSIANQVGQIWAFISRIQQNDWVACPLKTRSAIAVGIVQSAYQFRSDLGESVQHTRKVKWLKTELPRSVFDQDLLYSLGAFMTVCKIKRNDAESRVHAIAEGKRTTLSSEEKDSEEESGDSKGVEVLDVERVATDQIQQSVSRKYRGHKLAELVGAVLRAQGYTTHISSPGADGGLDILAGSGPLGFDAPRVCVQVKSQDSPIDVGVLRELRGVMEANHAEHGLLVSWGGFKQSVLRESVASYFKIRLWDQGQLLNQLVSNYDRLSETVKADLPLKRIWALTLDDDEE
jgi:restriction system protein